MTKGNDFLNFYAGRLLIRIGAIDASRSVFCYPFVEQDEVDACENDPTKVYETIVPMA